MSHGSVDLVRGTVDSISLDEGSFFEYLWTCLMALLPIVFFGVWIGFLLNEALYVRNS